MLHEWWLGRTMSLVTWTRPLTTLRAAEHVRPQSPWARPGQKPRGTAEVPPHPADAPRSPALKEGGEEEAPLGHKHPLPGYQTRTARGWELETPQNLAAHLMGPTRWNTVEKKQPCRVWVPLTELVSLLLARTVSLLSISPPPPRQGCNTTYSFWGTRNPGRAETTWGKRQGLAGRALMSDRRTPTDRKQWPWQLLSPHSSLL